MLTHRRGQDDEVLDVRAAANAHDLLEKRLQMERAVSTIASRLLATEIDELPAVIRAGLEELGEVFGADRAYVIALGEDGEEIELAEEWCAPGVPSVERDLGALSEPLKVWWGERIRGAGGVRIESVDDLGPDAQATRELLEREGVSSVAFAPVLVKGVLRGAVGMTTVGRSRRFVDDEIELLRLVGGAWVSRLQRAAAEQALLAATEQLAQRNVDLERSNRELEDFASVASHDLKSPLLVVRGFLELLLEQKDDLLDPEARSWILAATRGSDRMEQLIDDLLLFSRSGRRRHEGETVDLAAVWAAAEADSRLAIRRAGAKIECGALRGGDGDHREVRQGFQ
jgi:signal transduction histidine kinase